MLQIHCRHLGCAGYRSPLLPPHQAYFPYIKLASSAQENRFFSTVLLNCSLNKYIERQREREEGGGGGGWGGRGGGEVVRRKREGRKDRVRYSSIQRVKTERYLFFFSDKFA